MYVCVCCVLVGSCNEIGDGDTFHLGGTNCKFDKVYVDEVQDLTSTELALLVKISASGILFLAGDLAPGCRNASQAPVYNGYPLAEAPELR